MVLLPFALTCSLQGRASALSFGVTQLSVTQQVSVWSSGFGGMKPNRVVKCLKKELGYSRNVLVRAVDFPSFVPRPTGSQPK